MASGKALNVDAQRLVAIMEELTEKLTYLSVVSRQVFEAIHTEEGEKVLDLLGGDVARKLADQIRLEELYQRNLNSNNEDSLVALDTDDVQEITEQLEKNTRDLCRRLRSIANVVQELRAFQETRPINSMKLIHTLANMQEVMVKKIKTTVEEERARQELVEQYIQLENAASTRRSELEQQLTLLRTDREKEANRSSETIVKLKADLQDIQDFTEQRLTQLYEHYGKREADITRSFNMRVAELNSLTLHQQKHNFMIFSKGKEECENLKSKKKIALKNLERVINDYDHEMFDKETKVRELKVKNAFYQSAASRLQSRLQIVEEEKMRIVQEEDLEKTRDKLEERRLGALSVAASYLQSYWRGIRQREEYILMKKNARGIKKSVKGRKKKIVQRRVR